MLTPKIIEAKEKKLVGIRKNMSLIENKTSELWREFLPSIGAISRRVGTHKISLQNYPENYFLNFDPHTTFEKWAAVEVAEQESLPPSLQQFTIPAGLFAVFHYVGSSTEAAKIFQSIYGQWVPKSGYVLDARPHFEILGDNYKNNHPESEEDIWIPVKPKG